MRLAPRCVRHLTTGRVTRAVQGGDMQAQVEAKVLNGSSNPLDGSGLPPWSGLATRQIIGAGSLAGDVRFRW